MKMQTKLKARLGVTLGLIALALGWLALIAASWAEAAEPSDDYNFKWLDPDKKIYVLQNRRYTKAEHPMLSVMFGPGISNPYRTSYGYGIRGAYYFSEALGLEAFYTGQSNSENSTYLALKQTNTTTIPVVREIRSTVGLLLQYVPWYAKINVFNRILYFDWYFSGGVGSMNTALDTRANNQAAPSYSLGSNTGYILATGQLFHFSEMWLARIDLTGTYYQAPLLGSTGASTWYSNYVFGFGIGVKL